MNSATSAAEIARDITAASPSLQLADASGSEDSAVALDIRAVLGDQDGSETLAVTISGVPTGAALSAGTDNGDGSWSLTQFDLAGLRFTAPNDAAGRYTLNVAAQATESATGDIATRVGSFHVDIGAVLDAPSAVAIAVQSARGNDAVFVNGETGTVTVSTRFADNDGSQTHGAEIAVPDGLIVTDAAGGTWTPGSNGTGGSVDLSAAIGTDGRLDATLHVRAADTIPADANISFALSAHSAEVSTSPTTVSASAAAQVSTAALGVDGTAGDNLFVDTVRREAFDGGAGSDTVSYATAANAVDADLATGTGNRGDTYSNIENLTGGSGADSLSGDGNANRLEGGAGDDTLAGGGGADTLIGGTGSDTASFADQTSGISANLATGATSTGATLAEIENLTGGSGADTLTGNTSANRLDGGAGKRYARRRRRCGHARRRCRHRHGKLCRSIIGRRREPCDRHGIFGDRKPHRRYRCRHALGRYQRQPS